MRFAILAASIGAAAAQTTAQGIAQNTALELIPEQAHIRFTLNASFHTVHGTFPLKRGRIEYDLATNRASGEIAIDATGGETGNESRDRKMHKDVLESARYPEIVFRPDRVSGSLPHVELHGVLTLHGAEHEITLPLDVETTAGELRASGSFTIPYVEWGLKDPSTFFLRVAKEVKIEIQAAGRLVRTPSTGPL